MEKNKIKSGENSTVFQAEKINVFSDLKIERINHCGRCNELVKAFTANNRFNGTFEHCNDLSNVNNINSYIVYYFKEAILASKDKYIKPTLVISEKPYELGSSKYENYNDPNFIITDSCNQYLILGEAGIGKSEFLSKLFYSLIIKSLSSDCTIVPFFLKCDFFGYNEMTPREWLFHKINDKFPNLDIESILSKQKIKVYFLIDAINSIQYIDKPDFDNKLREWSLFINECSDSHTNVNFIVTSRNIPEIDYFDSRKQRKVFIEPLEWDKILDFISLFVPDEDMKRDIEKLVKSHLDMYFLKIPYFLLKIITTHKKSRTVKNKTDIVLLYASSLFENHTTLSANQRKEKSIFGEKVFWDLRINQISFFEVIFECAYLCQDQNKKVLTYIDISKLNGDFVEKDISSILQLAVEEGILNSTGKVYTFSHPILQEFFAAMYIYHNSKNSVYENILPFQDETMNLEVAPHIYNLVDNKDKFIEQLINDSKIRYAAECVVNNGRVLKEKVAESIVYCLESNECDNVDKLILGNYLGRIGDPRFIYKADYIEPRTVEVQGIKGFRVAKYPITNKEFSMFVEDNGYEKQEYWEEALNAYWLNYDVVLNNIYDYWSEIRQRFNQNKTAFDVFCKSSCVDVEQCASLAWFLSMTDNEVKQMLCNLYKKEKFSQPLFWEDPNYNNPSQPVVGVSYFEVQAYCAWLSSKSKKKYRLLTKAEWEYVAKSKQRKFVFCETPSSDNCNTIESTYQTILPVGILEANKTSEGIYDINGNIFEWTSTIYKDSDTLLNEQLYVKGGSWVQGKERAASDYNGRAKTWCRNLDIGFRVCIDENN